MTRILFAMCALLAGFSAAAAPHAYAVASDNFDEPADNLIRIDLATGAYTVIGKPGNDFNDIEGLAMAPDGSLYGADDATETLLSINPATGAGTPVNHRTQNLDLGDGTTPYDFGMTFACDGTLYLVSDQNMTLYQVNTETGKATPIGNLGKHITALATYGNDLYAIGSEGDNNLYRINPANADITLIGPLGLSNIFTDAGLAFAADGTLWGVADYRELDPLNGAPSQLFTIDLETGAATHVADTLIGVESLAIAPAPGCDINGNNGTGARPVPALSQVSLWLLFLLFLPWAFLARRQLN